MRMRLIVSLILVAAFMSLPAASASRRSATGEASEKSARLNFGSSIPASSYRSPGRLHKIVVSSDDAQGLERATGAGAVQIADYGSFKLLAIDETSLEGASSPVTMDTARDQSDLGVASRPRSAALTVRDDFNVLLLRSGAIDTTADETPGSFAGIGPSFRAQSAVSNDSSQLGLVQFVGPVKHAWIEELEASGLEPIAYVPNNGYLVRGSSSARNRLMKRNAIAGARSEAFVQWEGPLLDQYKIHPALNAATASGEITVAVQFALGIGERNSRDNHEVKQARMLARSVTLDAYDVLSFTNLRLKIDPSRIAELATLPSVVNIEPWTPPVLQDERASQIVASQLTSDGAGPRGPGYPAWLAAHGFSSPSSFVIDVSDTGLDRGSTTANKLHPDFLDSSGRSRVAYARDYTSELDPGDVPGHGTLNLSIAGGANVSSGARDSLGYNYGLGVAPFALLGSSKIFQSNSGFDLVDTYTKLVSDAYRDGARVSSNSWGDPSNGYSIDSQEYDARARDASPGDPGNQEITICFAAGNGGANKRISSPGSAKNVISVAASESSRKDGTDGCNVKNIDADNAMDIAFFSAGGPLYDGRMKPDITAPGTHIEGAASQNPAFDGSGVCGLDSNQPYFPEGQTLYTWSSGTSHSTPQVAGAAALVRQYLINRAEQPTSALTKGLLLNTTTFMTGALAAGDLPQSRQGWGLMNLDRAFDNVPKIFVNQSNVFTDSGQEFVITGEVKDSGQPFRVTLAWTDAPGFSGVAPWVNDLDLEVTINGQVYRGNNFLGQESQPGGDADTKNNVEAVWLPAGTTGTFVVRVRASNIAGDGVPGNGDSTDQDFALVVYNGEKKDAAVATVLRVTLAGGSDAFGDPGETVSMRLNAGNLSPVALTSGHGTLSSSTSGIAVTTAGTDFPSIPTGQNADGTTPLSFTIDRNVACGSVIRFVLDIASQGGVSRVPFTVRVGKPQPADFFLDDVEQGESKWTHGSAIAKKKNRLDTWFISAKRIHAGSNSWFTPDPGAKVVDSHLDTLPIQIPADARGLQLVFYHTFEFERGAYDGGVLEISTGGDFEDLGPKILKGRYNGQIYAFSSNLIAGRNGWVEGRLGTFQQVVVDLSSYAGKAVIIRFRLGTDGDGKGQGWYVDDVSLRGDRVSCSSSEAQQ